MYLQHNENKYKITNLISYNNKSFVVQVITDQIPMFDISDIGITTKLLLCTDDDKVLREIISKNYVIHKVYQEEETNNYTIIFSNEAETDEIKDNELTLEVVRKEILFNLTNELNQKFVDGVFLHTEQGLKQFSFEEHDQRNIANICNYLQNNPELEEYFYHANGEMSILYSRQDLFQLYEVMLQHITEWTDKYRKIREYINTCEDIAKLLEININTNIEE